MVWVYQLIANRQRLLLMWAVVVTVTAGVAYGARQP
jgi:predicted membrane protein